MKLTEDDHNLFRRVDQACDELLIPEFEKYIERKFNDQVPVILRKYDLMGIPISKKYGGCGCRYARPLADPREVRTAGAGRRDLRRRPSGPRQHDDTGLGDRGAEAEIPDQGRDGRGRPRLRAHGARSRERPGLAEDAVQEGRRRLLRHGLQVPDFERVGGRQADRLRLPRGTGEGDDGVPGRLEGEGVLPST